MNKAIHTRLAALLPTLVLALPALAGEPVLHEEHSITIKTSGAEVFEADLTDLAIGESRTFTTEAGKTIDLIRTAGGAEVYIDGELVDVGDAGFAGDHDVLHKQVVRKHFEVVCDSDEGCDDMVWVQADGDFDYEYETLEDAAGDAHKVVVIRKHHAETVTEE